MNWLIDRITASIKGIMRQVARALDRIFSGHITPTMITVTGAIAHVPIAWLIATGHTSLSAVLLVFFGLFDTLDGELARLQDKESALGMFLDSFLDRVKEVLLFSGMTYLLVKTAPGVAATAATAALGVSLCTSYLNAWGDAVIQSTGQIKHETNKSFRGGLLGFEKRIFIIIVGLLTNNVEWASYTILVLAIVTIVQRYMNIEKRLKAATHV